MAEKKNYKAVEQFEYEGKVYEPGDTWQKPDNYNRDEAWEQRNLRPKGRTGLSFVGRRELAGVFERDDEGNMVQIGPNRFKMAEVDHRIVLPVE